MRVGVIGNGAVGLFCADFLSKINGADITLIGSSFMHGSGSIAAGAMHASTGEVESALQEGGLDNLLYASSLKSRELMRDYILENSPGSFTASGTVVFINKGANDFERRNFDYVLDAAERFDDFEIADPKYFFLESTIAEKDKVLFLRKEFGFDARKLLLDIKSKLKQKIKWVDENVISVNVNDNCVETTDNQRHRFDRIIVASGAGKISFVGLEKELVPTFYGLGTALLMSGVGIVSNSIKRETVYRSVNRGGSQCGFHFVPCVSDKFYIGAGNRLSKCSNEKIRFETVKYLLEESEKDVFGRNGSYRFEGDVLLGNRSRSLDYYPLFGRLMENSNIFLAKGFNRVGLSLAPMLATEFVKMLAEPNYISELEKHFKPQRKFISHGSPSDVADDFAVISCANLIEHGLVEQGSNEYLGKKEELFCEGLKYIRAVQKLYNLDEEYGPPPDSLSFLATNRLLS